MAGLAVWALFDSGNATAGVTGKHLADVGNLVALVGDCSRGAGELCGWAAIFTDPCEALPIEWQLSWLSDGSLQPRNYWTSPSRSGNLGPSHFSLI